MSNIYSKIKAVRTEKKLSQSEMGKRLGINQGNYNRMEAGITQLTFERIESIAKIFEISVIELMSYEGGDIGESDISQYIKHINELEKRIETLNLEKQDKEDEEGREYSENKKLVEKLKTEISSLKNIVKEKDERLKIQDRLINTLQMVIDSRSEVKKD